MGASRQWARVGPRGRRARRQLDEACTRPHRLLHDRRLRRGTVLPPSTHRVPMIPAPIASKYSRLEMAKICVLTFCARINFQQLYVPS